MPKMPPIFSDLFLFALFLNLNFFFYTERNKLLTTDRFGTKPLIEH